MKLSDLKTHDEVKLCRRENDPEYAAQADRLALADAVSAAIVQYRAEYGLTQAALASKLGWKQPQVARLERGDVTPSLESLQRLARAGCLEVRLGRTGTEIREPVAA